MCQNHTIFTCKHNDARYYRQLHIAVAQEATNDTEAVCLAYISRLVNEGKLEEALEVKNNAKQTPLYIAAAVEKNTTLIKTFNEYKV